MTKSPRLSSYDNRSSTQSGETHACETPRPNEVEASVAMRSSEMGVHAAHLRARVDQIGTWSDIPPALIETACRTIEEPH